MFDFYQLPRLNLIINRFPNDLKMAFQNSFNGELVAIGLNPFDIFKFYEILDIKDDESMIDFLSNKYGNDIAKNVLFIFTR